MNKLLSLLLILSLAGNWVLYKKLQQLTAPSSIAQETEKAELPVLTVNLPAANASYSLAPVSDEMQPTIDEANLAFEKRNYSSAIEYYSDVLKIEDSTADSLLEIWLTQIQNLILTKEYFLAGQFLDEFLHQFPFHIAVLNLKAQLLQAQGLLIEAIEVYYLIHDNSIETEHKRNWLRLIHTLTNSHFEHLSQASAWQQLVDDTEKLLYFEPDNGLYLLATARAYIQLDQIDTAKEYLETLQLQPDYKVVATNELAQLEKAQLGRSGIDLTKRGAHYIVRGWFNRQSPIDLMIDTGASLSVMSSQTFDNISLYNSPTYLQHGTFNTAGGQVEAPVYQFEQFRIGPYRVNNIEFAVMELDGMNKANGLLGMNFLRRFHFQIDQESQQLLLEHR